MSKMPVRFWNSLISRSALIFTGMLVVGIMFSGYLVYRKSSRLILEYAQDRLRYSSNLAERSFFAMLDEVANDIGLVAGSTALRTYVNEAHPVRTYELEDLFRNILLNKPSYFQIRLIDTTGLELFRFDKMSNGTIEPIPPEQLQSKAARTYFQEAIRLSPGQIYFSEINLNEEYGVISQPETPTIRSACSIFTEQNERFGILIINIDLNGFYNDLQEISINGPEFYLLDRQGQYLFTPGMQHTFGIQKGSNHLISEDFDIEFTNLENHNHAIDSIRDSGHKLYLTYLNNLNYSNGEKLLHLLTMLDAPTMMQEARLIRNDSIRTLILVCLIFLLVIGLLVWWMARPINHVTRAISSYGEKEETPDLPVNRKDEIGVLARSFLEMRKTINHHLHNMEHALGQEKAAKQQRDTFLQNMSHELRTPLHTLQGLTRLLAKHQPLPAQMPIIQAMERSIQNLSGLVFDVLDHRKLIDGTLRINPEPTNVNQLMQDVFQNYQFEAIEKKLDFRLIVDPQLKHQVIWIDSLRLSQIVTNVIVNAIKYTETGHVLVQVQWQDEVPYSLDIMVEDSGPGLEDATMKSITEQQISGDLSGRYGSYGLGLSVVRQIVKLFEGSLEVEKNRFGGSTFHIRIPAPPSELPPGEATSPIDDVYPPLRLISRIIHMDDDPISRQMILFTLKHPNLVIRSTGSYREARSWLKNGDHQLLISDIMFSDTNISTELTALANLHEMPIVVTSALAPEKMQSISPWYFRKPFDPMHLKDRIWVILGEREYQPPDFEALYSKYDHDPVHIDRILKLLEAAFDQHRKTLVSEASLLFADWQRMAHQLITHLREIGLTELLPLVESRATMPDRFKLEQIEYQIRYILCCIRSERYLNSAG